MQPDARGIPVSQAARQLGISVAAARKRVRRGSLRGYKVDGQWMIVLPMSTSPSYDTGIPPDVGHGQDMGKDALIAQLQAENARLWDLVRRLAGERTLSSPADAGEGEAPTLPIPATERPVTRRKAPRPSPWWYRWFPRRRA